MENKTHYLLTKTCIGSVRFLITSEAGAEREVYLTDQRPFINLPIDWAVGVFRNPGAYNMYRQGYFTFDDPEGIANVAIEKGEYFDDPTLVPRKVTYVKDILNILKEGKKSKIIELCTKENAESIVAVIKDHRSELNIGALEVVAQELNIDLSADLSDFN